MDIKDILVKRLTSGLLFYAGAKANDYITQRFGRKYLKEHSELAVGIGVPLVLDMTGLVEKTGMGYDYIDAIEDAMSDYGIYKEVKYLVEKEMVAWASDANTIIVKNASDLANAIVIIDGNQLASGTDYTVEGDTISLTNALASGEHDLIIIDGDKKKALHTKIYV